MWYISTRTMQNSVFILCILCNFWSIHGFQLTILHTNDYHARIEETNKYSGACTDEEGKCYGGVARLKTKIKELKAENPNNTILVDAGDQFQGTLWFTHFGGIVSSIFMNKMGYDAMALGNHEFDRGIDGLIPFLKNLTFPALSCNIDQSPEPEIKNLFKTHHVLTVNGEKIGIIGYTTKNTPIISNPGSLVFNDEVSSLRGIVQTLQGQGVNKIIAVGHSGFNVDKKIATEVEGIDVIVGGHTNTFLYTGEAPSNDKPQGSYPTVVTQGNGNTVLVVQDYAYGKYLGVLNVTFDNDGKVISYSGNPVLLDHTVAKDPEIDNLTQAMGKELDSAKSRVLGRTLVKLEGDRFVCRVQECNMGNMVADSMVYQNLRHADTLDATSVFVAIVNSGSIRSSLERGNITYASAIQVQPFRNTLERITIKGMYIRQALENSVSEYDTSNPAGTFLQLSGIRVWYNLNLPVGKRVVKATIRCSDCDVPEFLPLENDKKYRLVLSNFVLGGGDGYSMFKQHAEQDVVIGDLDTDVFVEYVQEMSPLYPGLEGRIQFVNSSADCAVGQGTFLSPNLFISILLVMFSVYICQ